MTEHRPTELHREPTLWVASELYYPEETSTGHIMTRIAESLAERRSVRVLCAQPTYSVRGARALAREIHQGAEIYRVWSTTWPNERLPGRLVNLVTVTLSFFLQALLLLRRGDQVLVVTNPPVLPFAVAVACRLRGARCILLIHDLYPELLVAAGVSRPGSLPVRLLDRANRILYRFSVRVVVLGRCMAKNVRGKLDAPHAPKVRIIPNWADTDLIEARPRAGSRFLQDLGLGEKLVVQYAGNISRLNGIENLLETLELLRGDARLHLLFVGRGGRRSWLEEELERRRLDNATLVDWLPRSQSAEMHRGCDVVLIPLIAGMAGISVPSRLYNSLAAGRPVVAVAESESELARVVDEEKVGWVVEPGNPERLVEVLREASRKPSELAEMGVRARAAAERRFPRALILEIWGNLFEELRTETSTPP